MAKKTVENKAPAAAPAQTMAIDVTPSQEAGQGLTLAAHAGLIIVTDKASHTQALEFVKGAKQLKRKIEDHWSNITRAVDEMKRNLLNLKEKDLEPVVRAIGIVEPRALEYADAQKRREQEEADRRRREAEETARREREAELARQEQAALDAEANSPALSAREDVFVSLMLRGVTGESAARSCGYKDPVAMGAKLLATPKILDAISARKTAAAIREQAEAQRQKPLDVITTRVPSNLGRAAGVSSRTYYSCVVDDERELLEAVLTGTASRSALIPNQTFLNDQAKQIQDAAAFAAAYPGCRLVKRQGLAG